jgi:hypothetical protein
MIRGKITVKKWDIKEDRVARALTNQPGIRSTMFALAEEVAEGTRRRLSSATKPSHINYQRYQGFYWSANPTAVAAQVKVKDIRDFPITSSRVPRTAPVVLVVADHPYSHTYEKGLDGFPQTNAMQGAIQASANRRPRRLKRRSP